MRSSLITRAFPLVLPHIPSRHTVTLAKPLRKAIAKATAAYTIAPELTSFFSSLTKSSLPFKTHPQPDIPYCVLHPLRAIASITQPVRVVDFQRQYAHTTHGKAMFSWDVELLSAAERHYTTKLNGKQQDAFDAWRNNIINAVNGDYTCWRVECGGKNLPLLVGKDAPKDQNVYFINVDQHGSKKSNLMFALCLAQVAESGNYRVVDFMSNDELLSVCLFVLLICPW